MKQKSNINSIAKYMQDSITYHLKKRRNTGCAKNTKGTVKRYSVVEYLRKKGYIEPGRIQRPDCGEGYEGI